MIQTHIYIQIRTRTLGYSISERAVGHGVLRVMLSVIMILVINEKKK